jgi:hypothetical protein
LAGYFTHLYWDSLFWVLALAGLACVMMRKGGADEKLFFLSWLLFSVAAVFATFQFTGHYFVLMLPVVALLAARAVVPIAACLAAQPLAIARCAPWIIFGVAWSGVAASHCDVFLASGPVEADVLLDPANDFQVFSVIGDHIRSQSPPTATLAVFGSEPELPFYAHRRSVTGYIYMYDLVQDQPFRQRMDKEMMSEVEKGHADFVVFVNQVFSWLPYPPDSFQPFREWMMNYIVSQYDPCGVVTFLPNRYFWGPDCLQHVPAGHRFVVIYQRKPKAPIGALLSKPTS